MESFRTLQLGVDSFHLFFQTGGRFGAESLSETDF
jgi:hypothetical protein